MGSKSTSSVADVFQKMGAERAANLWRKIEACEQDVHQQLDAMYQFIRELLAYVQGYATELDRLRRALHAKLAHPDYEYCETKAARKLGPDEPYIEEGEEPWEINEDYHGGFERFEYYEECYWRRRKVTK